MTEKKLKNLEQHRKLFTSEQAKEMGKRGGIASGIARRKKAAVKKGIEYNPATEQRIVFPVGSEKRFILTGYETESDLHKAEKDLQMFLRVLLCCSLQEIAEMAKAYSDV